jgi:HAE1 family hydrophobic/amphiphilic exporter-1
METLSISVARETGANSIDVVRGLDAKAKKLNETILARKGLILNKVYDETVYINSAVGLVQQNIMLGGSLTIIILMLFLHLRGRTLIFVPLLIASSVAAIVVSPWFFLATLALVFVSGLWFARGTLVVAMAIPTSIIGTFLVLNTLGRSLNVISIADWSLDWRLLSGCWSTMRLSSWRTFIAIAKWDIRRWRRRKQPSAKFGAPYWRQH